MALRTGWKGTLSILQEFRTFLLRGNVVDLAVGVVVGVAFGSVVTAFVKDLITPLIAAIGAQPDFGGLYFTIHGSRFRFGDFVNQLLTFAIIAMVVFFFVVMPMNRLVEFGKRFHDGSGLTTRECSECLMEIPLGARRCAYCTSPQAPAPEAT